MTRQVSDDPMARISDVFGLDMRLYTDAQLLDMLIGSGGYKVLASAKHNLHELSRLSRYDLTAIPGIGNGKAKRILAVLELARRRQVCELPEPRIIRSPTDVFNYFYPLLADLSYEEFWILYMNRRGMLICSLRVSIGGVAATLVDPKMIFRYALEYRASTIAMCHNHPTGDPRPSQQDIGLTQRLLQAGHLLDIYVLDHTIIGGTTYYSFADEGLLNL